MPGDHDHTAKGDHPGPLSQVISIAEQEVTFEYGTSPGPGGQHVNKRSTQVTLCFSVASSNALTAVHRLRLRRKLGGRISRLGILRLRSHRHRSQAANKKAVLERFRALLIDALTPSKPRRKTQTPRSAVRKRVQQKRQRGLIKRRRGAAGAIDE